MERHCGQVKVMMYGHEVEKPVFCAGWWGHVYVKRKGSYSTSALAPDGTVAGGHSWTDLVIFDGWVRVCPYYRNTIIVRHIVESTKQKILGKVK